MKDFYVAGGFGMIPISVFGFLLVAATVLYALRPQARYQRLAVALGVTTFMMGLLGTALGIGLSARYIHQVPLFRQLGVLALGVEESLHNIVLSLILVVLAPPHALSERANQRSAVQLPPCSLPRSVTCSRRSAIAFAVSVCTCARKRADSRRRPSA